MSLDVCLTVKAQVGILNRDRIYVREAGTVRRITRAEWDARYPNRDPVTVPAEGNDQTVFEWNITHNLGQMAAACGVYDCCWRPEKTGITRAEDMIEPLRAGLDRLQRQPDRYRRFTPANGWGSYEGLVEFVSAYLRACEEWPDAEVTASR